MESDGADEAALRADIKPRVDRIASVQVWVDGLPIPGLAAPGSAASMGPYRAQSPLFSFNLPADNIWGDPPQHVEGAVADGLYLMLAPLRRGPHEIRTITVWNRPVGTAILDNTYLLNVVP